MVVKKQFARFQWDETPTGLNKVWFSYLKEVSKGWFPLGLHFGEVHGDGEVVDEAAVDVEDDGLGKRGDEDVADLLLLVPVAHTFPQSDPEQRVALEDFREPVEERGDLGSAQNGRRALLQRLLVVLKHAHLTPLDRREYARAYPSTVSERWLISFGNGGLMKQASLINLPTHYVPTVQRHEVFIETCFMGLHQS